MIISIIHTNSKNNEQVYYLTCPKIKIAVFPPEKEDKKYQVVTRIYINKNQYDEYLIGKYDKNEANKLRNDLEDNIFESAKSKHPFVLHQQKEGK